jgi:hypothetical protein
LADEHHDHEEHPFHEEGGIPVFDGKAERAERARRAEKREESEYKQRHTSIQRGILATQVILIVFGIVGTWVSVYQAGTARDSANQAKRASDFASDSIDINEGNFDRMMKRTIDQTAAQMKAAQTAQDAVKLTENQSMLDQRAWVAFTVVNGTPQVNQPFIVRVTAQNSGKTFAKKLRTSVVFQAGDAGTKPDYSHELNPKNAFQSATLLAPNASYETTSIVTGEGSNPYHPNLTADQLDKVKTGKTVVFIFGRLDYVDIFKNPHWTTFCDYLDQDLTWEGCDEHNDADENQPKIK